MQLDKKYYVNTGKDGVLADTDEDDVRRLVESLRDSGKVVIHFHGGLVNKDRGTDKAKRLVNPYLDSGAHPVFFIWESGLIETLERNLSRIHQETVFQRLLAHGVRHAAAKLRAGPKRHLGRSLQVGAPGVSSDWYASDDDFEEPYADLSAPEGMSDVSPAEEAGFRKALVADAEMRSGIQKLIGGGGGARPRPRAFGAVGSPFTPPTPEAPPPTLLAPEVLDELRTDAAAKSGFGVFSSARFAKRAGLVLVRSVSRFIHRRDHGVYPTVVEEILREFYVGAFGSAIWRALKRTTAEAFDAEAGGPTRGGAFFIQELGKLWAAGHRPEITLVGHSTGAVSICNMLRHVDKVAKDAGHPLPADFHIKNIVFLAPACSFRMAAKAISRHGHLFDRFWNFAMDDPAERRDQLVKRIYPRSLLYFVSGLLETDAAGADAHDMPIVGMERYFERENTYAGRHVTTIRDFVEGPRSRLVWTPTGAGETLQSQSRQHGAFDRDPATLQSLGKIIRGQG